MLDDTIFLAQNNLIRSIDITNRTSPSLSDSLDLGNTITDIALEFGINDTRMYVSTTDNSAELQVVDITDPSDISLL